MWPDGKNVLLTSLDTIWYVCLGLLVTGFCCPLFSRYANYIFQAVWHFFSHTRLNYRIGVIWSNPAAGCGCVHGGFLPLKHLVTALLPFLGGWWGAARCSWVWHCLWKWTHQPQRTNTQQSVQTDRETTQTLPRYHHRLVWTKISARNQSIWFCLLNLSWSLSPKATVPAAAPCSRC